MKTGDRESGTAAMRLGDGLTRRGVIAGLTSLITAPQRSSAQQTPAKLPRVGWIWNGPSAGKPIEVEGFRQGLKEFGYIEGQNVIVDYRFSEGRTDRIADLATELMQLRPDAVVAVGELATRAVNKVTTGEVSVTLLKVYFKACQMIPIVYSFCLAQTYKHRGIDWHYMA